MTDKVADFAAAKREREPHTSGELVCGGCAHVWVGIAPLHDWCFECPSCHRMLGRHRHWIHRPKHDPIWHCTACDCSLWAISSGGAYCVGCGRFSEGHGVDLKDTPL